MRYLLFGLILVSLVAAEDTQRVVIKSNEELLKAADEGLNVLMEDADENVVAVPLDDDVLHADTAKRFNELPKTVQEQILFAPPNPDYPAPDIPSVRIQPASHDYDSTNALLSQVLVQLSVQNDLLYLLCRTNDAWSREQVEKFAPGYIRAEER